MVDIIELVLNNFRRQTANKKTKQVKVRVDKLVHEIYKGDNKSQKQLSSFMTMFLNFMRGNFQFIPEDVLNDFINYLVKNDTFFGQLSDGKNRSAKKKLMTIFQCVFNLTSFFLINYNAISQDLEYVHYITTI